MLALHYLIIIKRDCRNRQSFFLFRLSSLPAFPWGLQGQQLKIKPPHSTVFHHIYPHFAWVKSQAIPSKILNVIGPSSSKSSNITSLLQFALASKACSGSLFWGILLTWPNHLSSDLLIRRSNGSMSRDFWISELHTLLSSVTLSILRKKLISDACTCDRTLSVITQDAWP